MRYSEVFRRRRNRIIDISVEYLSTSRFMTSSSFINYYLSHIYHNVLKNGHRRTILINCVAGFRYDYVDVMDACCFYWYRYDQVTLY